MTKISEMKQPKPVDRAPASYYVIDRDNIIVEFSGTGEPLRLQPGQDKSIMAKVIGTDFLSHISGEVSRLFYQTKISCLRDLERAESILYRSDAVDAKRYFRMTIAPDGDGRMVIYSTLLKDDPQPISVSYVQVASSEGSTAHVWSRCAICGQIGRGHGWHDAFDFGVSAEYPVKYDICRNCSVGFSLADLWS